ncbi:type II toxin-antitoxin system VapC family toxin [Candidatus Pyrohabitans sp.]
MYLDTDVILSLLKERDWLKESVEKKLREVNEKLKTSAITIVECQIVLIREESRSSATDVLDRIRELRVEVLPLTEEVLQLSKELLEKYPKLNIFDSLHIAHVLHEGEKIMSTDPLFDEIEGVARMDPLA